MSDLLDVAATPVSPTRTPQAARAGDAIDVQAMIGDLAGIFPGQIAPTVEALTAGGNAAPTETTPPPIAAATLAAPEGQRTRADIKALMQNPPKRPQIDKAKNPAIAARFASAFLTFDNMAAAVTNQLGGDPDARPLELNEAYDSLLARHATLGEEVRLEQERVAALLQAEPGSNLALDSRIKSLGGDAFDTTYFAGRLEKMQPPTGEAAETGIDSRDALRATLGQELTIAEAFKPDVAALKAADLALETCPDALRAVLKSSRPTAPASGIATEADFKAVAANRDKVKPWTECVNGALAFATALQAFDQAWSAQEQAAWSKEATNAVLAIRVRAKLAGADAVKAVGSLDPACKLLVDGKAAIEAGGRYIADLKQTQLEFDALKQATRPESTEGAAKTEAIQKTLDSAAESAGKLETAQAASALKAADNLIAEAQKTRRQEALKAEPAKNAELNKRIDDLQKGKFVVDYFRKIRWPEVSPKGAKTEDGVDARDAARVRLDRELQIAGAFKADFALMTAAEQKLAPYPEELRDACKASRPDVPTSGIASESDLKSVESSKDKVKPWIDCVNAAAAFAAALATFDKAWSGQDAGAWPSKAAAAVQVIRSQAETTASAAAKAVGGFDPACQMLADGKTMIEAGGRYATVLARIKDKRGKLPAEISLLGGKIDQLIAVIGNNAAPAASDFDASGKELTEAEATIALGLQYVSALRKTQADFDAVKRLVTQQTKAAAGQTDLAIKKDIDAATTLAGKLDYTPAMAALNKADITIAAEAKTREKAVLDRADALVKTKAPQEAVLGTLAGAKDSGGNNLVAELYLQFGETELPRLLAAMTGAKAGAPSGTPDAQGLSADVTGANIKALGASVGAKGIKELTAAFGGATGASNLGQTMKHGMNAGQVGDLHKAYGLDKQAGVDGLKGVFGTAFGTDPQMFAAITCRGMKGPPQTGANAKDKSVASLKAMTDAFADAAKLKKLVDGVKADDKATKLNPSNFAALTAAERAALKDEQCATAAKRMDNLLTKHFKGDAKKLKDPFYDQLEKQPNDEYYKLLAAETAFNNFSGLSATEKKGKTAPAYTQQMASRLSRLKNVSGNTQPIEALVRNAASFELKAAPGAPPAAPNANCLGKDATHFEERHVREHVTLKPNALAADTTPVGDKQDKPTTLWPEGATAAQVKTLVESAMNAAGPLPGAWAPSVNDPDFFVRNMTVNFPFQAAGKNFTTQIGVRLGVQRTITSKPNKNAPPTVTVSYRLTQFYPQSSGSLDTLEFEEMQCIKASLGMRTPFG